MPAVQCIRDIHLAGSSFGLEDVIRGQSQLATLASQSSRPTAYCDDDSLRGDGLVLTLVPRTEVQRDAVRVHETAQSVNVGHFLGFKVRLTSSTASVRRLVSPGRGIEELTSWLVFSELM